MRTLITFAAALAVLGSTGCWWGFREGGHERDGASYHGGNQGSEHHGDGGHHGGHDDDHR
jgi:ABC-type nickel/cobalt efflux system permease component RcnA